MRFSVVTPYDPAVLTVEQAKELLRIDHTHLDDKIQRNARSAISLVEQAGRVSLFTQVRRVTYDINPERANIEQRLELLRPPIATLDLVTVRKSGNAPVTVDPSLYLFDEETSPFVEWKEGFWDVAENLDTLTLEYTTGCETYDELKEKHPRLVDALAGVLMTMFDTEGQASVSVPNAVHEILSEYYRPFNQNA